MPVLRSAPECHVKFEEIRPAGFRILGALDRVARLWVRDLWLTSGTDGDHSGPTDPHNLGEAFDVRSKDCVSAEEKQRLVRLIITELCESPVEFVTAKSGGYVSKYFFAFLESPGTGNEHIHIQRRKGLTFP